MTVRVLYVDVDGTLVGPLGDLFWTGERELTLEPAEAIVDARRAGLELVPLSGRNRSSMVDLARLVGAETWIGELGGLRSYGRGAEVVVDTGAYTGDAPLCDALRCAASGLLDLHAGRLEEHAPWNEHRETSIMLRGELDVDAANARLAEQGFGWAECIDNGVIPHHYESLPGVETVRVFHLNARGVSKRAGVAADRRRRGIRRGECAVVGDAAADLACHPEVARTFVVANALEKDPTMGGLVDAVPDAEITRRDHGQGFADVVRELIGT